MWGKVWLWNSEASNLKEILNLRSLSCEAVNLWVLFLTFTPCVHPKQLLCACLVRLQQLIYPLGHLLTPSRYCPCRFVFQLNISFPCASLGVAGWKTIGTRGDAHASSWMHTQTQAVMSHLTCCQAPWMCRDPDPHRNLLLKQLFPRYPPSNRHEKADKLASRISNSETVRNGRLDH